MVVHLGRLDVHASKSTIIAGRSVFPSLLTDYVRHHPQLWLHILLPSFRTALVDIV